MIHFLAPGESPDTAADYVIRANLEGKASVLAYEDVLDAEELPHGLYVFTGINRLGPHAARLFAGLHEQIEAETGVRPLNHPLRTLRRYELLRALHDHGLSGFTAYGAWEDYSGVRLPAFVRPREADGGIPTLVRTLRGVESDLGKALMDGRGPEDLIVVEFEDTSVDGVFTKYSAYVVGDRVVPSLLDRGSGWVMRRHAADLNPETIEAEMRYVFDNPHASQLAEIFALSGTTFGRMDYSMKDGRPVCWEINTLPLLRPAHGVAPPPPELQALRQTRRDHFDAEFAGAFADLLDALPEGRPIRPARDPALVGAARRELEMRGVTTEPGPVRFGLARALLRPFKPILKPIAAATLQPLLARRARNTRRAS